MNPYTNHQSPKGFSRTNLELKKRYAETRIIEKQGSWLPSKPQVNNQQTGGVHSPQNIDVHTNTLLKRSGFRVLLSFFKAN